MERIVNRKFRNTGLIAEYFRAMAARTGVSLAMTILLLPGWCRAAEAVSHTFDLLAPKATETPSWVEPVRREEDALGAGTLFLSIHPPADAGHLAVTLIFRETGGETLSVKWHSPLREDAIVISENLLEALDGAQNQRTIVLNRTLFGDGGTLEISYSSPEIAPSKLALEWVEPYPVLTKSGGAVPALITDAGKPVDSLSEGPFTAHPDKFDGNVADATLIADAESLEDGLTIEAPLSAPVAGARVCASVLNLPWDARVALFVNGAYLGNMELEVPGLKDPGYSFKDDQVSYSGWRRAGLSIPGSALKPGTNTITFLATAPDAKPLAAETAYLRDGRLQLLYAPNQP